MKQSLTVLETKSASGLMHVVWCAFVLTLFFSSSVFAATAPLPQANAKWVNSMGMVFKPVPGTKVLFSQFDTRVKDYTPFVKATKTTWNPAPFPQTGDHPAVNINWVDANAFCQWLTKKEQKEGKIGPHQWYRLPTNAEWTIAAGGGKYPWGDSWPPPQGFANYGEQYTHDGFQYTSPVGSFKPNQYGLYDMGGNVWQWCQEHPGVGLFTGTLEGWRTLRGGSWYDEGREYLELDRKRIETPTPVVNLFDILLLPHYGFRCVLVY